MNKNSTGFANLKNKTTTFEKLFRKAPPPSPQNNFSHLHVSNGFISHIKSFKSTYIYIIYNLYFIL